MKNIMYKRRKVLLENRDNNTTVLLTVKSIQKISDDIFTSYIFQIIVITRFSRLIEDIIIKLKLFFRFSYITEE